MPPALGPEPPRVAGETAPKTGRSRVTSHLVRIEIGCSTRGQVAQGFVGQCVQQVLGLGESMRPSLLGHEFGLQPSGNPILLVGWKGRQLGEDVFERLSHASRIPAGKLPNKPLPGRSRGRCRVSSRKDPRKPRSAETSGTSAGGHLRRRSCSSLRSGWSPSWGTSTPKTTFMLGAQNKATALTSGRFAIRNRPA